MKKSKVRIIVRYRPGVLDPQGRTISNVLKSMGYTQIESVHTGKIYELDLNGPSNELQTIVQETAEKIFSNPLIEDYEIQWLDVDSES